MLLQNSTGTAQAVINHLDGEVWNNLANKAVTKMPKYKLTKQSEKMFDDFAILNSDGFIKSAGPIKEQRELLTTFKENLIVGTIKVDEMEIQRKVAQMSMPQSIAQKGKDRKRLVSAIQLNNNKEEKDKKFFRLTMGDLPNHQEQKFDDNMRTAKYDNIRYNQSLQQSQRERRAISEHRSLIQKKKFKEMKTFTYDYQGKLISLGQQKNVNAKINVVNMKPNFGNGVKTLRESYQKMNTKQQKILQILNKRVIGAKTPAIQVSKQADKEKDQRGSRHVKISQQTPNMNEYFKEDKLQTGVTLTDINNKSKFYGAHRDKNEIKNAKLTQFKGEFRQLQKFRDRITFKKLKLRANSESQPPAIKTEHIQSTHLYKLKTQGTEKQSRIFTAATGTTRKRGIIDVKNQRLYTQNFIEDID